MELKKVLTTCMDIPSTEIKYGHLPQERIYEWATYQTALSADFLKTKVGTSMSNEGSAAKTSMLNDLEDAFKKRGNHEDWDNKYKDLFSQHLEDPGTLANFRYFCVPDSDEMIMFYTSIWTGDMASAMEYLHRWGKDLKGNYRKSPKDEAWYQMTEYEGIAVNERIKAQAVANIINSEVCENVCFFGGGNLPERLYDDCLYGLDSIHVFETGKSGNVDSLANGYQPFEYFFDPNTVIIHKENLFQAADHTEIHEKMDLVVMHGVSMYLGKDQNGMIKALQNANSLLRDGGIMSFDYLLLTEGMKRTATAQHWPHAQEMKIFDSVTSAIAEGKKTILLTNETTDKAYFNTENIEVNSVDPWGETSIRFILRKYA